MTYDPQKHHRQSIRLKGYDYSRAGAYFVTVCTQGRACLFGDVMDGEMRINDRGEIVRDEWTRTGDIRPNVELDAFIVMPNHFHGIIILHADGRGESQFAPTGKFVSPSNNIGAIIRGFKSASTKRINEMRGMPGVPVWQRNYYEHIIRNDQELGRIREYIVHNPMRWELDRENPYIGARCNAPLPKDEPWRI